MPGSYSDGAAESLGRWRFALLNLFFLLIAIGLYTKNIGDVTAWPYYNWLWDYEFGFMRRALPGSILAQLVSPPISYVTVGRVSLAIGLVLTILLSVLSAAVIHRHFRSVMAWTLVLGFLFAGFGIKAIAHAIGTFEQINFIISIIVLLILSAGQLTFIRIGLAGPVAAPMLLIHEGAIFFCFPVLLTYLIIRLRERNGTEAVARFVLFMTVPGIALLALLWHPMPNVSPEIFIQAMRARGSYDELTMVHDMLALFNPSVPLPGRTFLVYMGVRFAWIGLGYTALFLAVLLAFNKFALVRLGAAFPGCNVSRALIALPVIAPAVGLLIAGDLLRFVALIPLGLFILYSTLALDADNERAAPASDGSLIPAVAMAMVWASSFLVFPAIGAYPNIPDRLKCILNYYPNQAVPIYRDLCLEQRIEYYREHK